MPGSAAETVYGRRGGGWQDMPAQVMTGEVFGAPGRCATCRQERACSAIASDPRCETSGRWFVCSLCQAAAMRLGAGLRYEPIGTGVAA